jgi:N-acetylglucosamine-6-phosphate deacetylase
MNDSGKTFAISAPSIFDGEHFLQDHCVIVRQGAVAQLVHRDDCPRELQLLELATGTLAPGLVDLQVNGGGDLLFNNAPTETTVNAMLAAHRGSGTTAILPTFLSDTREQQLRAVAAVRAARAGGNPGILGIHLEGPFFEPARRGAHSAAMIRSPQEDDIAWLCSLQDLPTVVTVAPEHMAPGQIRRLSDSHVRVCAGHSNASCEQVLQAVAEGLQGITHLFNAMSPLKAREPGVVGAALTEDRLWAGIIADGHHVHPASVRLAWRGKPAGQLLLVSDAMATVGGSRGSFSLYGEDIRESGGVLVNSDGKLAGSAIGLIDAVKFCAGAVGLPLDECLRMASRYPAAAMGLEQQLGRIAAGYRADLVHFDESFAVHNTWLAGERMQHRRQ